MDGTASTNYVVCRLFGTTITTVTRRQSPAQHICAKSTDLVRSLFSRVQARRDRPTPCPLFDGVGMNWCSLMVVDANDSSHLACNSNSNILFAHRSNHNTRKVTQLKSRNRLDTREDTVLSG